MKRNNTKKLVLISLCIGINVIGALIAVTLKLPIFLDTIGTFLIAFLLYNNPIVIHLQRRNTAAK